jgi:hypothetical protein
MSVRHVVLLRFDGAPEADVDAIVDALRALPDSITEIRSYVVGRDAGLNPGAGNYDVAVMADFADEAAYVVYRDHPVHQRVIAERIAPIVTSRAAAQYLY